MVHEALVGLDVSQGAQIISALDSAGIAPDVALWMATPEHDDGRLVIASKHLDQHDPMRAYEQVVHVLHERMLPAKPALLVLRLKDPFIATLRKIFGKTSSVDGMRLGGQSIANRFVSDAYVYRIK